MRHACLPLIAVVGMTVAGCISSDPPGEGELSVSNPDGSQMSITFSDITFEQAVSLMFFSSVGQALNAKAIDDLRGQGVRIHLARNAAGASAPVPMDNARWSSQLAVDGTLVDFTPQWVKVRLANGTLRIVPLANVLAIDLRQPTTQPATRPQ